MNTNLPVPATHRNPTLREWTVAPRTAVTPARVETISRWRRWIRATLNTFLPAPILTEGEPGAEARPGAPDAAAIDSRELPPWRPFSPRF